MDPPVARFIGSVYDRPVKGFLGRGAVIGVCCLGCGFDSSGSTAGATLGAHETGDSTSGSPATASSPMTTEPGGSDRDDSDTSDPTETMGAADDDPTVDPSETDTSKEPTDTDSTSTTDDDGGLETTGLGFEPYTACPCIDDEESCVEFVNGQTLLANVCYTVPCALDLDCPPAPGGTATPICVMAGNGYCGLDCANGATCPNGMNCYAIQNDQFRCAWPAP